MKRTLVFFLVLSLYGCAKLEPLGGSSAMTCSPLSLDGVTTQSVCYQIIDGMAVYQGDIVLGRIDRGRVRRALTSNEYYLRWYKRWDNGVMPYTIEPDVPDQGRIHAAIAHYAERTRIRLVPRSTQPDFVTFRHRPGNACYATLGKVGGQQFIDLDINCKAPEVIHEIGHSLGLWHEQGRADRDAHVTIHWGNILPGFESAFAQNLQYTQDHGPYDPFSIMHYAPTAFSKNGAPTLTRKDGSTHLGPGSGLSNGDLAALAMLYGAPDGGGGGGGALSLVGVPHAIAAGPASGAGLVYVWEAGSARQVGALDPYPGFTGGVSVAVGDVNGDGVLDVATAAGPGGGPHVKVFDGRNGSVMRNFFPYEEAFRGGVFVALGDVNGDGAYDIITGTGVGGGPRVTVFDGRSSARIADFFAYEASFRGGVLVAAADVDADGRYEIITGTGPGGGPRVRVIRLNQSVVHDYFAYEAAFRGGVKVGGGDLDGDGFDEILTGTGPGGGPRVTARSGRHFGVVTDFFADDPGSRAGVNVAATRFQGRPAWVSGAGPGGAPVVRVHDVGGHLLWQAAIGGSGANVGEK